MKFRSKLPVLAAAAALTAVSATSAMAMEHQFSGSFKVQFDVSNFNGTSLPNGYGIYSPELSEDKAPTSNFVDSRARLGYTAKANNDLKFVSIFELDYSYWGNSSYGNEPDGTKVDRNGGGALGADTVNFETKHLYLDANFGSTTNLKLGMQGFDDAFKGIFVSSDMAGALLTHSYTNAVATVGVFRWNDSMANNDDALGQRTSDYFVLDGKYKLSKETKIGAAYYFLRDRFDRDTADSVEQDAKIHTLGLNMETVAGPLTLDGFVLGQFGEINNDIDQSAFAANIGARMKVGKGTLRGELLYTTGDDGSDADKSESLYSAAGIGGFESGYYNSEMLILTRDKNALTIDNAIVYEAGNQGHGLVLATVGYDLPINDRIDCSGNLGFAWNETSRKQVNPGENGNQFLGTEINAELNYKYNTDLSFGARGAYVVLGDYFEDVALNNKTPDNPYDIKLIAKYTF